MPTVLRALLISGCILILCSACQVAQPAPLPTPTLLPEGALQTQAQQTFEAQLTQFARNSPTPSNTPAPTPTRLPTFTPVPTRTPFPTITPIPSPTLSPTITPSPIPVQTIDAAGKFCYHAEFIADVTIPDNTPFRGGEPFTKIWQLKNIGTCEWSSLTALVFVNRDLMGAEPRVPIRKTVAPGESIDLSINLAAPLRDGAYQGNWQLEAANGLRFGTGAEADGVFWVRILVGEITPPPDLSYDFARNYCQAQWRSAQGSLDCPGDANSTRGFVIYLDAPNMEHAQENEPGIWTQPNGANSGWIAGIYPAVTIKNGDHFLAQIGCLKGYQSCDVMFRLEAQLAGNDPQKLGEWRQLYDGAIRTIDIDLSSYAKKEVVFWLIVEVRNNPDQAAAFWLLPHIESED